MGSKKRLIRKAPQSEIGSAIKDCGAFTTCGGMSEWPMVPDLGSGDSAATLSVGSNPTPAACPCGGLPERSNGPDLESGRGTAVNHHAPRGFESLILRHQMDKDLVPFHLL